MSSRHRSHSVFFNNYPLFLNASLSSEYCFVNRAIKELLRFGDVGVPPKWSFDTCFNTESDRRRWHPMNTAFSCPISSKWFCSRVTAPRHLPVVAAVVSVAIIFIEDKRLYSSRISFIPSNIVLPFPFANLTTASLIFLFSFFKTTTWYSFFCIIFLMSCVFFEIRL